MGIVNRAILSIGKLDCDIATMHPVDPNVEIIGASSDYLILSITNNKQDYHVGSIIQFELGYFSLMRSIMSEYVTKNYI